MTDRLRESYRRCADITRRHGKTYAMAARLLAPRNRRHVHAVYAFCRYADDIVDDVGERRVDERAAALQSFGARFRADLAEGRSDHPVLAAVVATVREIEIDSSCFDRFLASMAMDLTNCRYATWDDLLGYMDGSAAVIGEMMLPVLGGPRLSALPSARALGIAFQMTNFLRDVGEDLERNRVYVPTEDLVRFGADPWRRDADHPWRELMRFEIARTRAIYEQADQGIALLPPRSARCVRTARVLYSEILDRIEGNAYDVFDRRARVPATRKSWVAVRSLTGALPRVVAANSD